MTYARRALPDLTMCCILCWCCPVTGNASQSNDAHGSMAATAQIVHTRLHRPSQYQKVTDGRKRQIRGLWVRSGRSYAQLTVEDEHTSLKKLRRVPLEEATTPAQARKKLENLLVSRRKGKPPVLKRTPKFSGFADRYVEYYGHPPVLDGCGFHQPSAHHRLRWRSQEPEMAGA